MGMTEDRVLLRPPRERRRSRTHSFLLWTYAALILGAGATAAAAAGGIESVKEAKDVDQISVQQQQSLPSNHPNSDDLLLKWLLDKGGYWNPKQYIGRSDPSGLRGVIAGEFIEDDEVLVEIPWEAVITPFHYKKDQDGNQDEGSTTPKDTTNWDESLGGSILHPHDRRFANCDIAVKLNEELSKIQTRQEDGDGDDGNDNISSSDYGPYVSELQKTVQDHYDLLPAHWSKHGQQLLSNVLGISEHDDRTNGNDGQILPPLPPHDMFFEKFPWKSTCEQVSSKEAVLLVMTHGEEFGMVPVTDKYNSRGGKYEGAYFKHSGNPERTVALQIRASRDLEPNESITTTYYDDEPMGVPELLRDYGYIEPYPQKFIFHFQNIGFIVSEEEQDDDDDNDVEGDNEFKGKRLLKIEWLDRFSGRRYIHPKKQTRTEGRAPTNTVGELYHALSYLHRQYDRLVNVCPTLETVKAEKNSKEESNEQQQDGRPLSEHEISMTTRFCSTMLRALEAALVDLDIIEIDDGSNDNDDEDDEEDEDDSDEDLDHTSLSQGDEL